jgi:hypothetical protein
MTSPPSRRQVAVEVFAIPCLLAGLSAAGLVSGLLGDGIWDVVASAALAVPLAVIGYCISKSPVNR